MVEPIGSTAVTGSDRAVAPVTRAAAAPLAPPASAPAAPRLAALAGDLAARPPVDLDRVARIRQAIGDGTFRAHPAAIADRLIALEQEWTRHDDAA